MQSKERWSSLLIGLGLGIMIGPALVELGWLHATNKAWVTLVGAGIGLVGALCAWRKAAKPIQP